MRLRELSGAKVAAAIVLWLVGGFVLIGWALVHTGTIDHASAVNGAKLTAVMLPAPSWTQLMILLAPPLVLVVLWLASQRRRE
jgi:hypothetical protein